MESKSFPLSTIASGGSSSTTGTLVFGAGYVGSRVAQWARQRYPGQPVYVVTRSRAKAAAWSRQGFLPVVADWNDGRILEDLPDCGRVLVAVSFDARAGYSREESMVGGLRRLLNRLPPEADLVYLSTTGVYHQTDGSWVDETSPTRPVGPGGQAHLRAEELLHRLRPTGRWVILRLAGIYGPGRLPRAKDILAGRPIEGPNRGFLNLIHRDDAAAAVLAAWDRPDRKHRLYLVSDDLPVPRRHFYEELARCLRCPPPTFVSGPSGNLSARSSSDKRIWNRRIRQEWLPRLLFPDYLRGLPHCLQCSVSESG